MRIRKKNQADIINAEHFDVEELRDIVFKGGDRLTPVLALSLLGRKKYPDKLSDMQRVLADKAQPPRVRHTAAVELSRIGSDKALDVLMSHLDVQDTLVLRGVLDALGSLGGDRALAAVAELNRGDVARSANWAATLIAYRRGVKGFEIAFPKQEQFIEVDPDRAQTLDLKPADAEVVAKSIAELSTSIPGIALTEERAMAMQCGDRTWMFLFNKEFAEPQPLQRFLERTDMLCVVAVRYVPEALGSEVCTAKYYVLTQPVKDDERVQILVTTTRGMLALAGTAEVVGEQWVFTLRTVEHPGATPVEIEGVYEAGALHFIRARSEPRRLAGLVPDAREQQDEA